jgi:hypothetical protein
MALMDGVGPGSLRRWIAAGRFRNSLETANKQIPLSPSFHAGSGKRQKKGETEPALGAGSYFRRAAAE